MKTRLTNGGGLKDATSVANHTILHHDTFLHCKSDQLQQLQVNAKSYLDEEMEKSPPSNNLILQNSIPLTNGTAVSSSRVKCV